MTHGIDMSHVHPASDILRTIATSTSMLRMGRLFSALNVSVSFPSKVNVDPVVTLEDPKHKIKNPMRIPDALNPNL